MFNVPVVVVYLLSLCFFSSISLFYAFLFLCFWALCFIIQTSLFYMLQCHAWGFISVMALVGHSRVDSSIPLQMVPVGWV